MTRNEIKRAILSKSFLLALGIMTVFAVLSAVYMIETIGDYNPGVLERDTLIGAQSGSQYAPEFPLNSVFSAWVGGDTLSMASTVFFSLIPICAALPYAWSYHTEKKCGYIKNIFIRTNRGKYYAAKTIAVFASGALAVLIPYIINILLVSAHIPYYFTWAGYNFYNRVYFGTMWADVFFTNPFLHMLLFVLLNTLYGGIFALLSYAVSFYIKNILAVLFLFFFGTITLGYTENVIYSRFITTATHFEFVPTRFLHSRSLQHFQNPWIILSVTIVLIIFAIGTVYLKGHKNEVY